MSRPVARPTSSTTSAMRVATAGISRLRAGPNALPSIAIAWQSCATVASTDWIQTLACGDTGETTRRPAAVSRMRSLLKSESAPLGIGGRTTTPDSRRLRASTTPRRA